MTTPETHRSASPRGVPRVLLLAESPYFGGITAHLLALCAALAETGGAVPLLACLSGRREDRALFELAAARGIHAAEVPMSGPVDFQVIGRLRALARDLSADLVHTHNYRATLLAAAALRRLPRVISCHGIVRDGARVRRWQALERRAMRGAAAVVACSESVRVELAGLGVPEARVSVVRNGAPAPRPADPAEVESLRLRLGLPREKPVLLYAGRLDAGKGVETLIEAAALERHWRCVVAGDGPLRATLERLARDTEAPVLFAGQQADMAPWYALADAVALPSESEALPMTLIEAAASGTPVIASNVGGVPEVVVPGETGLLVPPGDPNALARALQELEEPETRACMGAAAHVRWAAHFTLQRMAQEMAAVYVAALSVARASRP
ncbi:MAG: glycosyltransferase family 4 protein [Candidatus Hydrogenedens sp.]|nr:glycosyltransferase family 4 protein [Candidatus Hydrogenedentota bacterium]NLF57940.1 glycosyltransferase family 4 protein [Candidatus Hydrogenedens sp.]